MNVSDNSVITQLQNTAQNDAEQKLSLEVYGCHLWHAIHGYSTVVTEWSTRNTARM